ncbi:MAG TPA: SWIM zinc finger family protein [Ktedonobacteraceae bacterium]|nr:SWIM zinc finger family protein [Ktedonobacteraceae bacterium]
MGRWNDDYEWNYYNPSRPKKVEGGLKTRSERGEIGSTWWSKRWLGVLESFSMGTRLTRGRSYARQGQVVSIDVEPGLVKARVQGSMPKPYNIKIRLKPLSDRDWEKVTEAMASQALFAARLLAGEMPTNIEEAFHAVHLSLFPTAANDLETDCSCPDWANPCKHIAAVYYLLAERFDEDPFLIFKLRGRTKDQIIQALRAKRTEGAINLTSASPAGAINLAPTSPDNSALLEDKLDTFWQAGEGLDVFAVNPTAPRIDKAILKRLGNAPFTIDDRDITSVLSKAYDVVDAAISR